MCADQREGYEEKSQHTLPYEIIYSRYSDHSGAIFVKQRIICTYLPPDVFKVVHKIAPIIDTRHGFYMFTVMHVRVEKDVIWKWQTSLGRGLSCPERPSSSRVRCNPSNIPAQRQPPLSDFNQQKERKHEDGRKITYPIDHIRYHTLHLIRLYIHPMQLQRQPKCLYWDSRRLITRYPRLLEQ